MSGTATLGEYILRPFGEDGALAKIEASDGGRFQIATAEFWHQNHKGIVSFIANQLADTWLRALAKDTAKPAQAKNKPAQLDHSILNQLYPLEAALYEEISLQLHEFAPQGLEGNAIVKSIYRSKMICSASQQTRGFRPLKAVLERFLEENGGLALSSEKLERHLQSASELPLACVCFKQIGSVGIEIYVTAGNDQNMQTFGLITRYNEWIAQECSADIEHLHQEATLFAIK